MNFLRNILQQTGLVGGNKDADVTDPEMDAAIAVIREAGPIDGNRTGVLTDVEIPVPNGPVDKW